MIAKIWNYSGWINNCDPKALKKGFRELLEKSDFAVLGFKDHVFDPCGYTCIWILGESHLAVHTFPEEGCAYIELSSCNEAKLYDFLAMLPDYFDTLISDADGGIYPAEKDGILIQGEEDNPDSEDEDETTQH